jgi:hypothetical protein
VERNAVRRSKRLAIAVIGGDADRRHGERAHLVAVQKVVEAMVEPRHEDQDARTHARVVQRPLHAEARGDRPEGCAEDVRFGRALETVEREAHHEPAGVDVAELRGLDDVAAMRREARADRADDARPVVARQGEDESVERHDRDRSAPAGSWARRDKQSRNAAAATLMPSAPGRDKVRRLANNRGILKYSIYSLARNALSGHARWPRAWRNPDPAKSYDAVIVGAGGHGLATAYYLAKEHGMRRIAVLEKGWLGGGNTGRNTTIVRSNYHLDPNALFYELSLKLWEGLSRELNFNVMYSARGVLNLVHSPAEMDAAMRRGNAMRLNGIDAEFLSRDESNDGFPTSIARGTHAFRSTAACCSLAGAPCATTRSPGVTLVPPTRWASTSSSSAK